MTTRVLLVDDHQVVIQGLTAFFAGRTDITVVGTAGEGLQAIERARELRPDVIVMDVSMPGMNGIEATRKITSEMCTVKVLLLSMHSRRHYLAQAFQAGAAGYLLKENSLEELSDAIRAVTAGKTYVSPSVAGALVRGYVAGGADKSVSAVNRLTAREREVLQLIAEGHSTKEIAGRLELSAKTISTHREHVMSKLEISSVAGLTKFAIRHGLTSVET